MDRQRGRSSTAAQPRLLGLGMCLGTGAAAGTSRSSLPQLKPAFAAPSPSSRPGSLTSSAGPGVLPLRSVSRHSFDADSSPAPDTGATTAPRCATAPDGDVPAAIDAAVGRASRGGSLGIPTGAVGAAARPATGPSPGRLASVWGASSSGSGGHLAGKRSSIAASPSPERSDTPVTPPVHIQWLPPVPRKPALCDGTAPTALKLKAEDTPGTRPRVKKQVQWLLPEKEEQPLVEQQGGNRKEQQPGRGCGGTEGGAPAAAVASGVERELAQLVSPPLKKARLDIPASTGAREAPARRLGGLRQPVAASPLPAPRSTPLQALSHNVALPEVLRCQLPAGGPPPEGATEPQHRRRRSLIPHAGQKKRPRGASTTGADDEFSPAAAAGVHIAEVAAGPGGGATALQLLQGGAQVSAQLLELTAAQWTNLERHLCGHDGHAALEAGLNTLTVLSFTAPPLSRPAGPQEHRHGDQQQAGKEGGRLGLLAGAGGASSTAASPVDGSRGESKAAVAIPTACAGLCEGPCSCPPLASTAADAARRHGMYDPGGLSDIAAVSAGQTLGTSTSASTGDGDRNVMEVKNQHFAGTACTEPYCDLCTALRAHLGVVRALWRLIGAAVELFCPPTDAVEDEDCRGGSSTATGAGASDEGPPLPVSRSLPLLAATTGGGAAAAAAGAAADQQWSGGLAMAAMDSNERQPRSQRHHRGGGAISTGGSDPVGDCVTAPDDACGATGPGLATPEAASQEAVLLSRTSKGTGTDAPPPQEQQRVRDSISSCRRGERGSRGAVAEAEAAVMKPPLRLMWGACAANVLRNLAVADLVPEQLLWGCGLETCAGAMEVVLRREHRTAAGAAAPENAVASTAVNADAANVPVLLLHDLVSSLLELLTALPHCLRLPDAAAMELGEEEEEKEVMPSKQQPQHDHEREHRQTHQEQAVQPEHRQGQQVSQLEACSPRSAAAATTTATTQPKLLRTLPRPRPLLQCVMSLLTAGGGGGGGGRDRGAHVPLQLRTLAAGLLAAWLANPVNKEVVLQALLPPPSQPPALAPLATPTIITATATTATTATTTSTAPTVAMATTSASSLAAAASASGLGSGCGERAPLDALQELLTLSPAAAAEEVRREAAAAATTTIGEGPVRMVSGALPAGVLGAAEAAVGKDGEENGGNGSGSGACQRLELLQAQRRSDAVAAAVEVLYALACGCGPMGRRLLGAHPGIQSGLAALATGHSVAAADDTLRGCTEREREAAAAAGVGPLSAALSRKPYVYERDLLVARCRATLSAASEVATEVLAALASEETHMANVNDDGDEAQQQRLKEATAEDPHDMREERPSSRS